MQQFLDSSVGQLVIQLPIDQAAAVWTSCAAQSDYYDLNQDKDGKDGYQFDHVPHHLYHTMPEFQRNFHDIWNLNAISIKVVCFNCGYLTCCGGPTNKKDYIDEFKSRHRAGCPLVNALRSMNLEQLQQMSIARLEQYPNTRRSYYRSFMNLNTFNDVIRSSRVGNYRDTSTKLALQTMWVANCICYQLHFSGPPGGPSADDELENPIVSWFDNEETADRPCARYRFGLRRLCAPCMNPNCSFFGGCTVHEHYLPASTYSDANTRFKHVGAVPLERFEF
jgi:hypothetical protein